MLLWHGDILNLHIDVSVWIYAYVILKADDLTYLALETEQLSDGHANANGYG